jgi:adenylyltransferase/sulfurtransferase
VPLSGLYQHEYREIGADFPYGELTLAQLGIPSHDVLHIVADGQDYYYELNES